MIKKAGIIAYGSAIPAFRVSVEEIAEAWGKEAFQIEKGLGVKEKTVADLDEDSVTLAVDATKKALMAGKIDLNEIGAVYMGSESHPYAVNPSSTIVAEMLGIGPNYHSADLEFACKAGTAAMQIVLSHILSGEISCGIAIGSDTAQGAPGDMLEYTAASGAASFVLGSDTEKIIASIEHTHVYNSDTPDFWRPQYEKYPSHGGRFTGAPGYFRHVLKSTEELFEKTGLKPRDFAHVIFHMPNASFSLQAGKYFGLTSQQMEKGLIAPLVGNTYSASSLLGLVNVLDHAKAGELVLMTSYGSGAGSNNFVFRVSEKINDYRRENLLKDQIENKENVSYSQYIFMRGKIAK